MLGLQALYDRLPVPAQHLAASLQGARYAHARYGREYSRHLEYLRATEFAPADDMENLQVQSLRSMVAFAARYVPYYQRSFEKSGLRPHFVDRIEDLSRIPLTSKADLRRKPSDFLAQFPFRRDLIRWQTSGTTGSPIQLFYEPEANERLYAFVELYRNQACVSRADRRAQFTGKPIVPARQREGTRVFWRFDAANRSLLLSSVHLLPANLPDYASALRRYAPAYLCGYPSAMYVLAQYFLRTGEGAPRLRAALTSAETLLPHQRKAIEEAFQTRVFDQYGQTEMQSFWYECCFGAMHAHPLAGVTEILRQDGTPAPPGEEGEVVLTGLINRAMPLLRYRIGDRASFSAGPPCPCGRKMKVIRTLGGRKEDFLYTRERGFLGRLDPVFKGVSGIVESQIVQESLDMLKVYYTPEPDATDGDLANLLTNLRASVGGEIGIEFVKSPHIPRTANGKFRAVVSHLPGNFGVGEIPQTRGGSR
jgi:phenylacetate-CoA ligase